MLFGNIKLQNCSTYCSQATDDVDCGCVLINWKEAPMTKIQRLSLIAAFTVFAAIALPQSCYAQPTVMLSYTAYGTASLSGAEYNPQEQPIQTWQYTNAPATLTLSFLGPGELTGFGELTMALDAPTPATFPFPLDPLLASPAEELIRLQQFEDATFDVSGTGPGQPFTISSFMTNGTIFLTFDYHDEPPSPGEPPIAFDITFQGSVVPEPSSLVLAGSGLLVILIFAWVRGIFIR
jgi:PEP-CTERM motif